MQDESNRVISSNESIELNNNNTNETAPRSDGKVEEKTDRGTTVDDKREGGKVENEIGGGGPESEVTTTREKNMVTGDAVNVDRNVSDKEKGVSVQETGKENRETASESGGVDTNSTFLGIAETKGAEKQKEGKIEPEATLEKEVPEKAEETNSPTTSTRLRDSTPSNDTTTTKTEPTSSSLEPPTSTSSKPDSSSTQTRSVSPNPPLPTTTKRFSSSLSVNKKFLEKAGEKAHKPEPKLATTRLSTPTTTSNPVSTSHPRLLTGKLSTLNSNSSNPSSSGPTIQLSTKSKPSSSGSTSQTNSQQQGGSSSTSISWSKKPTNSSGPNGTSSSGTTGTGSNGSKVGGSAGSGGAGGAVWSTANKNLPAASGPGMTTKVGTYGGIGLGRGGFNLAAGDFPTAAEAAHAKEARARALMEQMQARERALQARAAAAAAQNANLLQNLDAFRGVHLDPNAHHWDEDEDDFLDTTIEFGDGTQYKITEEDAAAAQQQQQEEALRQAEAQRTGSRPRKEEQDGLREPSPSELARLETPLGPGEVEETITKSREERFGDDYDRSWPPRKPQPAPPPPAAILQPPTRHHPSEKDDSNRNLFNDRLGKLEPAQHGHSASNVGRRRMSSGADRTSQDLPPHLIDRRDSSGKSTLPPARRPSITSRHHEQAPPPVPRNAWPRRPSNDLPTPAHGGRQLPPHLAAAQSQSAAPTSRAPPSSSSVAPPSKVLSPPQTLAPLPEANLPPPTSSKETEPTTTEADLEALHAREMHAAAERAKKRRQEEEQARLEQIERAKKKAAELEEKMRQKSSDQKVEKKPEEKVVVAEEKAVKAENPWRTTAKPPVSSLPPAIVPPPQQPTSTTNREPVSAVPAQPTSILTRPAPEKPSTSAVASAPPPPRDGQSSTWRRPSNPSTSTVPPPSEPRSQQRQVPPHLAQSSTAPVSSPPPTTDTSAPLAERPNTPPPPQIASPSTVPSSPSHERKTSAKSNPLGYKVPEVSQLDDLMSRIKGAMSAKDTQKKEEKKVVAQEEVEDESTSVPTVKLPPPTPTTRLPRSRSNDLAPTVEPRGRGRGRTDVPRNVSRTALPPPPTFENRDPLLPFSGTRRARSPSPPPAWKAYAVKIAPRSPHKAPHYRNVSRFLSNHGPRPVPEIFSSNPLAFGINPRRLNRDETLIPKKFVKGVPQCPVKIPSDRITRRTREEEQALNPSKPTPTVSISAKSTLVRATVTDPEPAKIQEENEEQSELATAPVGSRGRGRGRVPDSGTWRRAIESVTPKEEVKPEQVEDAKPVEIESKATEEVPRGATAASAALKSKLPVGSSIGFYRSAVGETDTSAPKDRSAEVAKSFMVTSELNGEKIAATPREETTAPGIDLAARSKMTPSSPPFKPKDVGSVLASPSAAWTNKSLALSVLDPTASSVWSATPVDSTVHARTISENQPENSLQGIVDDDPSVALPSSLAELKSEDEQSNEGKEISPERRPAPSRDDAKLRAVAPSFSSFLHDSAAAIDTSTTPSSSLPQIPSFQPPSSQQSQHRPQALAFTSSYGSSSHHSIPPQSTPSPVNPYSPSTLHLYGPGQQQQYARSYPSTYGLSSGSSVSPFLSQPTSSAHPHHHHPHSHSHQHFSPASPAAGSTFGGGYPPSASPAVPSPNLYARPLPSSTVSQSIPHGITNPALIANYNNGAYGQNVLNSSSSSSRYGAVGAGAGGGGGRSNVAPPPPPPGQQQGVFYSQQRPSYSSSQSQSQQQIPSPSSYLSQPSLYMTTTSSTPNSYLPPLPPNSYRTDSYHSIIPSQQQQPPSTGATSSYDYPHSRGGGQGRQGGHHHNSSSTTTMPSPVIVPQHLPPPGPFFPVPGVGSNPSMRIGTNRFVGSSGGGGFSNRGGGGAGGPW